jgi:hypothetical protein
MRRHPILAHGGAIPPLLVSGYLVVGGLVGGIVLMSSKRPGHRWVGAGLLICAFTGAVLLLVFFDAFVKFFADAISYPKATKPPQATTVFAILFFQGQVPECLDFFVRL